MSVKQLTVDQPTADWQLTIDERVTGDPPSGRLTKGNSGRSWILMANQHVLTEANVCVSSN